VTVVSQHKATRTRFRVECPGLLDAHADRYPRHIGYFNDSLRRFQERDLFGFFEGNPRGHVLLNPVWWTPASMEGGEVFRTLTSEMGKSF
jgi:hypothetical protein